MRARLLDLIVCPSCKDSFSLAVAREGQGVIEAGTLTCRSCKHTYPIRSGVPRLQAHVSDPGRGATTPHDGS